MVKESKARLYVAEDLTARNSIHLAGAQGHYLTAVMRVKLKDKISLFNGRHGEWLAEITAVHKGNVTALIQTQTRLQNGEDDLWYLFAPLKKARLDYMVQKATELGVSHLQPVLTERTHLIRLKADRIAGNAVAAAEQCERLTVPTAGPLVRLDKMLADWPEDRLLIFCDETAAGGLTTGFPSQSKDKIPAKAAILIGPEGGFSPAERTLIRSQKTVLPISLGPRILRADTAAVVALALWQAHAALSC